MVNKNELMSIEYESSYGAVKLDYNIIRSYFTKGKVAISDQEILLHMELCKRQKLDPFVTGEVFLIKYKEDVPATTVIGYATFKRRAEESPNYLGREEGIVVLRGSEIVKKEGTCVYPGEKILGGWCRVSYLKKRHMQTTYSEVDFKEYSQDNSMWRGKPATMICKVAVSQALRNAFPIEFDGLYTAEEIAPREASETDFKRIEVDIQDGEAVLATIKTKATQSELKSMFEKVHKKLGEKKGNNWLKEEINNREIATTSELFGEDVREILEKLETEVIEAEVVVEETPKKEVFTVEEYNPFAEGGHLTEGGSKDIPKRTKQAILHEALKGEKK